MRKASKIAGALCLLSVLAWPSPARGQAADTVYVGSRHSAFAAGFLEFVFPTAGFAYAGDWTRGFLPNAVRIGSGIAFDVSYDEATYECDDACTVWAVGFLAATVWAIVGAVRTAHDYNETIRTQPPSSLLLEPSPGGGWSVGLRLRR